VRQRLFCQNKAQKRAKSDDSTQVSANVTFTSETSGASSSIEFKKETIIESKSVQEIRIGDVVNIKTTIERQSITFKQQIWEETVQGAKTINENIEKRNEQMKNTMLDRVVSDPDSWERKKVIYDINQKIHARQSPPGLWSTQPAVDISDTENERRIAENEKIWKQMAEFKELVMLDRFEGIDSEEAVMNVTSAAGMYALSLRGNFYAKKIMELNTSDEFDKMSREGHMKKLEICDSSYNTTFARGFGFALSDKEPIRNRFLGVSLDHFPKALSPGQLINVHHEMQREHGNDINSGTFTIYLRDQLKKFNALDKDEVACVLKSFARSIILELEEGKDGAMMYARFETIWQRAKIYFQDFTVHSDVDIRQESATPVLFGMLDEIDRSWRKRDEAKFLLQCEDVARKLVTRKMGSSDNLDDFIDSYCRAYGL
jgi:hypothetical protein